MDETSSCAMFIAGQRHAGQAAALNAGRWGFTLCDVIEWCSPHTVTLTLKTFCVFLLNQPL